MNGLEATEIKLSEILEDSFRIDSEHFKKEYLKNIETIKEYPAGFVSLGECITSITGGATPLGAEYLDSGVGFVRVQNVMYNYMDDSDMAYISETDDLELKRSKLKADDVLLTITGVSYGKASVVTKKFEGCNINQHSVKISFKDDTFSPYFLSTFLNAKNGKFQSDQNIVGVTRPALDYETIKNFKIPLASKDFQKQIEKTVKSAHAKLEQSKRLYAEAEEILLEELGLKKWRPPKESAAVKPFKESFGKSGRLDAEYFHPQKDYAFRWLSKLSGQPISEHFQSVREMYNPPTQDTGKTLQTFDLSHALNYFIEEGDVMPENEIGSTKKKIKYGDVVVSKLRSYLKEIAVVETQEESLGSSEFIVLRSHGKVTPELLMVYLRSKVIQTILQWSQDGSNHPRFQQEELLAIKLPDKLIASQKDIQKLIRAGVKANQESKRLLELSKRAVESAIEKGEKAGMKVLES